MRKSKLSFESSMHELEEIVDKLESGKESLENSLKLYERGTEISAYCQEILDSAKQKMTVIENQQ